MIREQMHRPVLRLTVVFAVVTACAMQEPQAAPEEGVPVFELDPHWPRTLPNDWINGPVTGLFVDSGDHVWLVHHSAGERPEERLGPQEIGASLDPPIAECCIPAPPVLEFDPDGNVVQGWGGPGYADGWPSSEHGVFVDHNDEVWVGGYSHHHIMRFTRDGQLLMTIGEPDSTGGSNDPDRLGGPAQVHVNAETNEIFVADGYRNRRVVVYDAGTGAYLRHWGAYGEQPDDDYEFGDRGADVPPPEQFALVHGLVASNDGRIYVTDRRNNRIQVFEESGEFVAEAVVAPGTLASGSAFSVALSHDPDQRFLYLADGTNHKVWILTREDLEIVGEVGRAGRQPGQFLRPHNVAVDSRGNLYVGEANPGRRVQRFRFQGFRDP